MDSRKGNAVILLGLAGLAAASFGMSKWAQADKATHAASMRKELASLRARGQRGRRALRGR